MFGTPPTGASGVPRAPHRALPALALLALAAVPAALAAPAAAQSYRTAIGVTGGWSSVGDLTPGFTSETVLGSGWTAGLQLETWLPTGRVGFRAAGSVAARTDQNGDNYGVINADLGVLARLLAPAPGRIAAPYALVLILTSTLLVGLLLRDA